MPSIVIRLDPRLMQNADADVRYQIPASLEEISGGRVKDCGYGYEDETDAMHIYLNADDLQVIVPIVIAMVENNEDLKVAARIGISEHPVAESKTYAVVYPSGVTETITAIE